MSRICKGKGPFTCPSCDWNENCRFAYKDEQDDGVAFSGNEDGIDFSEDMHND